MAEKRTAKSVGPGFELAAGLLPGELGAGNGAARLGYS
jgi:hypothetical protein